MALEATISLTVQDLPENDIWFINAQAWKNYWANTSGTVELVAASNLIYTSQTVNVSAHTIPQMVVDGVPYTLVPMSLFNSLLDKVNNLDVSYQNLREAMKDAGYIQNSQPA